MHFLRVSSCFPHNFICKLLIFLVFSRVFFAVRAFISSFSSCFLVFSTLCTRLLEGANRPKKAPGAKIAPNWIFLTWKRPCCLMNVSVIFFQFFLGVSEASRGPLGGLPGASLGDVHGNLQQICLSTPSQATHNERFLCKFAANLHLQSFPSELNTFFVP